MTQVFNLVEVGDEELVPKVKTVLRLEVLFWLLTLLLALAHAGLQGAADNQIKQLATSANVTSEESSMGQEEKALHKEMDMPDRSLMSGLGGGIVAAGFGVFAMIGVTCCLAGSVSGIRQLNQDGQGRGLKPVFLCEMFGSVVVVCGAVMALQIGLWFGKAKEWAESPKTQCPDTAAAECQAHLDSIASQFGQIGTFYFLMLIGLITLMISCALSARGLYKLNPQVMIGTGSLEAMRDRVSRNSIETPSLFGPIVRRMSVGVGHKRSSQDSHPLPQTVGKD